MIFIIFSDYARLGIPQLFVEDSGLPRHNNVTKLTAPEFSGEYSDFVFRIRGFSEGFKSFFLVPTPAIFFGYKFLVNFGKH